MLILYTKDDCKKCDEVKDIFEDRRLTYEERNIADEEFKAEAEELGAKDMPFMFDTQANYKTGDVEDMVDFASEYAF